MEKLHKPDLRLARKRTKHEIHTKEYHQSEIQNIGVGKKYLIQTHGCQANEADTEILAGLLEEQGFTKTDVIEETDVLIINTCAIREKYLVNWVD